MARPRLLDLFSGAGGAAKGYQRAGFHVTGVDNRFMPRYCGDKFHQADALEFLAEHGHEFDAIHASPPCQAFTNARVIHGKNHADLLTPTREALRQTGLPWVIENVPGAPMRADVILCGSIFGERRLRRHRWFEFDEPVLELVRGCQHQRETVSVFGHGGHVYHDRHKWAEVMGIDWMNRKELAQAIPPAYTEFIGKQLLQRITKGVVCEL